MNIYIYIIYISSVYSSPPLKCKSYKIVLINTFVRLGCLRMMEMVERKTLKMSETTTEKKAMPKSTHSRLKPPTNNRNTDGERKKVLGCEEKVITRS